MCLDRIGKFSLNKNKRGYKWVEVDDNGEYWSPEQYPHRREDFIYKKDAVNIAEDHTGSFVSSDKIDIGFHIFNNLEQAKASLWGRDSAGRALVEVEYDDVTATGYGDGLAGADTEIIVAQKMRIIRQIVYNAR